MNVARYLASALLLALLSGCATYPISKEFRQQAKEVTFDQVRANPESTRGTIVIWGGRIINVVNDTNGSSIYILCLPIRSNEKPIAYGPSPGRFIATSTGFLDPEMFPQGSRVTVAGQLGGVWTEPLGKVQYAYPVVDIQETHVWPRQQEESYGYPYYGYYGPGWGWDWGWGGVPVYYGGFYHGFHGGFHGNFHGGGDFHGEAESRGGGGGGEGGG
ncbi:MAG: Slp family lipoprotein, partial [Limisphaerales bacterium]